MTEPDIRFGRHAKNALRWLRGRLEEVTPSEIIDILQHPDAVTPTEKGRLNAWRFIGPHWIRVTYITRGDRTDIVTVTAKRTGPP
jgi:hypothetical protein